MATAIGLKRPHNDPYALADPVVGPPDGAAGNGSKRQRGPEAPSRVLFFRRLSPLATEDDLHAYCGQFGGVVSVLRMRDKNQAFVEMDSITAAEGVVFLAASGPPIHGIPVDVHFSPRASVISGPARPEAQSPAFPAPHSHGGRVLHVTLLGFPSPVSPDDLAALFSVCGAILRLVCFDKNGHSHALVEFADGAAAAYAREMFHGKPLFGNGSGVLTVDHSKLATISMRPGDPNARDYGSAAGPHFPSTMPAPPGPLPPGPPLPWGPGTPSPMIIPVGAHPGTPSGSGLRTRVLLASNLHQEKVTPLGLFKLFGTCGDVLRVKILYHKRDRALIEMRSEEHADRVFAHLKDCPLFDMRMNLQWSKLTSVPMPPPAAAEAFDGLTQDFTASPLHRFGPSHSKNAGHVTTPGPALHLSNLPDDISEAPLLQLFGGFGAVLGLKFFVNTRKMAIVYLDTVSHAAEALMALHGEDLSAYGFPTNGPRGLVVSFAKGHNSPNPATPAHPPPPHIPHLAPLGLE